MADRLVSGFVAVFSGRAATITLTILITPVLVRLLGSDGYGDYAFVLAVVGVLMILVNAGIFDGTRKFIAEDRDDPHWEAHVFRFYLHLATWLALVAATLVVIAVQVGLLSRLFESRFEQYFLVVAILLIGRQLFQTARGTLMGMGLESYSESFVVGREVTFAIVGLALAAVWGVTGVLVGHVIASVLVSFLALAMIARRLDSTALRTRLPDSFPRRRLGLFNLESVVLITCTISLYHIDILILLPVAGSHETGLYRGALLVAEFLWFVPHVFQVVLLHSSSELWSQGRRSQISELSSRILRYTITVTLLLAMGIAALVEVFMRYYFGPAFVPASVVVLLLLPGVVGFAVARPLFAIGQGKGQLRLLIIATGTAAGLNLVLNLLLIPPYGMYGAAVATSIGYGSMLVFHVLAARKIGFDPLGDLRLQRLCAVVAVSAPVIFGSAWLLPPLVGLVVVPILGGTVYGVAAIRFRLLSPAEVTGLLDRLPASVNGPLSRFVSLVA